MKRFRVRLGRSHRSCDRRVRLSRIPATRYPSPDTLMVVLILAAGPPDNLQKAGFSFPKNLVEVNGKPLLQVVMENLAPLHNQGAKFVFVVRQDEIQRFHTDQVIKLLDPGAVVIGSYGETSGAACTALLAIEHIDNDQPLLVANGDQLLERDHNALITRFDQAGLDGGIPVFEDVHPRYSFARIGHDGLVVETAEKRPISNLATAGRYWFRKGQDFVRGAMDMILKDSQVNGAFYVVPVYNQLILKGARIGVERVEKTQYRNLNAEFIKS